MPISFDNILTAAFYLGGIGAIVLAVQLLFHWKIIMGEYSRKLTHILVALWMAFWLFTLSQLAIVYLGLFLLFGIFIAQRFKMFNSIFGVNRLTYGEAMFVIGIMVTALLFPNPTVYALAVVNLGLADGFAAIIGTCYGTKKYTVFGSTKSLIGMFTAFSIVVFSGSLFWILAVDYRPGLIFVITHLVATGAVVAGLEFVSSRGIDNLTIPLATGLLYSGLIV